VPIIASISTLIPQKGLDRLLDAAALLRDAGEPFFLVIGGDGYLREPLRQKIEALRLNGHVRMLGWVPQAAIKLLPACDILVQSSLWEAMSVVVLEAMAAAKPMVVTDVGENPHVVRNETTGIVVSNGDARALAEALQRLLNDPALRARLANAARQRYEEHFTVQHMITEYEHVYRELMMDASTRDRRSAESSHEAARFNSR
jgi:glycosyltransferase involved in cell wall biosynthesis